jgi:predicted SAM-dependent methyltransferase
LSTGIPVSTASFDAVVAGEFIEHLAYADVLPTLAEFRRVLRPGGRALMTTPNPDSLRIKVTRGTMLGGAHLSAHYPKQLAQMMTEVGFRSPAWCGSGKSSTFVGERFPLFDVYGSYLIWADHL